MHVAFVLDVDTLAANPQELIEPCRPVPAWARVRFQLANPDPGGLRITKPRSSALFGTYPQIDRLVAFLRIEQMPWNGIKLENLPESWKAQFAAAVEKNPAFRNDRTAIPMFVVPDDRSSSSGFFTAWAAPTW